MAGGIRRLPVPFEDIEVCFLLDDVETWFLATVERMHLLTTINIPIVGHVPLATGTVLYHSAHGFEQVREDVEFLHGDDIRTTDESTLVKVPTPWRHIESVPDQDEDYKNGTKTSTTVQEIPVKLENDAMRTTSMGDVVHEVATLQRRLFAIENTLSSNRGCHHEEMIRERVQALKALISVEMIARFRTPVKGPGVAFKNEDSIGAHSAVTRSSMNLRLPCDYKLFKYFCSTIDLDGSKTKICPCLFDVMRNDFLSVEVIFEGLRDMCTCLGISCTDMEKYLFFETASSSGTSCRVVGGLQLQPDNKRIPIRFFIGASCSKEPPTEKEEEKAPIVLFPNAIWDGENNTIECSPVLASGTRGMDMNMKSLHAFKFVWERDHRHCGNIDARIGHLKITVPYSVVRNPGIVHELKNVLSDSFIRSTMQ